MSSNIASASPALEVLVVAAALGTIVARWVAERIRRAASRRTDRR
jgi:hypothetical protein